MKQLFFIGIFSIILLVSCGTVSKSYGVVIDSKPISKGVWYTRFYENGSRDSIIHMKLTRKKQPLPGDTATLTIGKNIDCRWGRGKATFK